MQTREIRTPPSHDGTLPSRRAVPGPIDALFAVAVLALVCFGLVMLLSASMTEGLVVDDQPLFFFAKQFLFTLIGATFCFLLCLQNPRRFDRPALAVLAYAVATALLAAVLVPGIGIVSGGARRWFSFGSFQLQPSEIAKFLLVFCLAVYYSRIGRLRAEGRLERRTPLRTALAGAWLEFLLPMGLLLVWLLLIALEPHFSGIAILILVAAAVVCVSGARPRSILIGLLVLFVLALALALVVLAILPFLPESVQAYTKLGYVMERIETFLNPTGVDADQSWQTIQALQAIGSGGLTGVGLGLGRQKFGYLPMSYNDYIFAIIGEELGFLGALAVLFLFLFLLVRGGLIARRAASPFGYMLAAGYTVLLAVQALLNIGVATNTVPPTGISLPFFSYGGSSNLFFFASVGIILAVSRTASARSRAMGKGAKE